MFVLHLDAVLEARLAALSRRTGRTMTAHAHEAVCDYLEDAEAAQVATERLRSPRRTYSAKEVKRKLRL